jgi:hypothetical protein
VAGPTVYIGAIERYATHRGLTTARDPLDDLVLHLDFLSAKDFAVEALAESHKVGAADARQRAPKIASHARLASAYIAQALSGPQEVSFVSCYYAILNLIKIYILCSSNHQLLATNRLHGASYNPNVPMRRSLAPEVITLHSSGALPLFYQTITGQGITRRTRLRVRDLYPFLADVSAEWHLASGRHSRIAVLRWGIDDTPQGRRPWFQVVGTDETENVSLRQLPVLVGFRKADGAKNRFTSRTLYALDASNTEVITAGLRRHLLYCPHQEMTRTALNSSSFQMFEEWPIALVFYHLSSVARYRPEFLDWLHESRYWPVVAAARSHALFKFLVLFWSYVRQEAFSISHA